MTRWAKEVTPENVWTQYPRPQMVRPQWANLNGLWDYAIVPKEAPQPPEFAGKILVPFAAESALSGVMQPVGSENRLWYRRTFELPKDWSAPRVLLQFGAVDWESTVWVNGQEIGTHQGGYDPFTLDITKALRPSGAQEIVVSVWDPTNEATQPRGKQVNEPKGIWYTAVTGIWQTAWIEPVPAASVDRITLVPDVDRSLLRVHVDGTGIQSGDTVRATATDGGRIVATAEGRAGEEIELKIQGAKLWSPDSPFLYDLKVELIRGGESLDAVQSYFGMRKISLGTDDKGLRRIMLNDKFLFQIGPLDQGWWPDGLYTAPSDEALRYDIEVTKQLGYNMLRKHVKVEPARLYYWCDKLGVLVWQDMPSGDKHVRADDEDLKRTPESAQQFELELKRMIDSLRNHPSIIIWVPFNEGWGQYDTARITDLVRQLDPTRLVNSASGWVDRGTGDMNDMHRYPGPGMPSPEKERAIVLGEFGGLGLPLPGHLWQEDRNWGYRTLESKKELTQAYLRLMKELHPLVGQGLSAAVYTQTTDVEIEVNGLMTYDRAVLKMDAATLQKAHAKLHEPAPQVETIMPTSETKPHIWRYTTKKPAEGWEQPGFDDSDWQEGPGGFGTESTPGAKVGTEWKTPEIWLRRKVSIARKPLSPDLAIHHDEDAEVYIGGVEAARLRGFERGYVSLPLSEEAAAAIRQGENVIAVHCKQTTGGQYIDVGLQDVVPTGK
ncbi:MAG: glycoside hydrolase family 2 protein [Planctomycetota bacterium]